jgi:hypothetical protein
MDSEENVRVMVEDTWFTACVAVARQHQDQDQDQETVMLQGLQAMMGKKDASLADLR